MTDHYAQQREADSVKEFWDGAPKWALNCLNLNIYIDDKVFKGDKYMQRLSEMCGVQRATLQQAVKPPPIAQDAPKPQNPYQRTIIGLDGSKCVCDVYRVLEAFEVDSHAIAHSIKKLLAPGKRHAKTREQDLREAIKSIEAELVLMEQRK